MFNAISLLLFISTSLIQGSPQIDPQLTRTVHSSGVDIRISMKNGNPQEILQNFKFTATTPRHEKLNTVHHLLKEMSDNSQSDLLTFLKTQKGIGFTSFKQMWTSNAIIIRGATDNLIAKLMRRDDIGKIGGDKIFELETPIHKIVHKNSIPPLEGEQWGLNITGVPTVWSAGFRGQGIVVANIDSGVRGTHESIRDNWMGPQYGWLDPAGSTTVPTDILGHGTHTISNIVGTTNGIGMAPNSTWMACRGCTDVCSAFAIEECGNWLACPYDASGETDCGKAPHVISNSWGSGGGDDNYAGFVNAWRAGGIIPLFSAGNAGPQCSQLLSPSDYDNVIAVGATAITDELAEFSSPGPALSGARKPDISAPGHFIYAAYHESDESYATLSGTSMACPCASGLVVLMLSRDPNLTYDDVKDSLEGGAVHLKAAGRSCGGISDDIYPNNHAGWGRISAVNSVLGKRR